MAEIARRVGVHPVYLASEFRRRYGLTVGEYVRQLRIEYASRQLSTSDTPLVEIALNSGFSSQSHFSWTFKRITGITPAQFRAGSRS
jgi:AraC family transcriptional regulator